MQKTENQIVYSIPVTEPTQAEGETPAYRNPKALDKLHTHIPRYPHISTLQALYQHCFKEFSDLDCMGTRIPLNDGSLGHFEFKTYKTVYENAQKAGSAIMNLDLAPIVHHEGYPDCRFIIVYEKNCEQWATLDIACCLYGLTLIPMFDALGVEALHHIFNQTDVTTVFTSGAHIDHLLEDGKQGKLFRVKNIVCLKGYTQAQKETAEKLNLHLMSWEEFMVHGEKVLPLPDVKPETVFSICYTSGTTGLPKGVILVHSNIIAGVAGVEETEALSLSMLKKGDLHLSHLPLAHIYERVFLSVFLSRGVTIGFFSGNPLKLAEDMQVLKPNYILSVPRLYNRFYAKYVEFLNKLPEAQKQLQDPETSLVDIIESLPSTIRDQMKMFTGGQARCYVTGSAPISPDVKRFLRAAFSAPMLEGYGQTESSAGVLFQHPEDPDTGNACGPCTTIEFKLVDIPEMNYTSKDKGPNGELMPRGELCLRGPPMYIGYYREPEKTAEAKDKDGWHHTGDIAVMLPNGALKLIDRIKHIFKLSQGEYVAPERIENILLTNEYVAEVFIHGDSLENEVVGVVVPNKENLLRLAKELGVEEKTFEELCKESRVIEKVIKGLNKTGKEAKLLRYELPGNVHLEPVSFSLLGLTTPSMKLQRHPAKVYFEEVIKGLYSSMKSSR